jgi:hypothetical protein
LNKRPIANLIEDLLSNQQELVGRWEDVYSNCDINLTLMFPSVLHSLHFGVQGCSNHFRGMPQSHSKCRPNVLFKGNEKKRENVRDFKRDV